VTVDALRRGYSRPYSPRRLYSGVPFDKVNDVRHKVIEQTYLRSENFSHVLHIDSDTIVLNSSRTLKPFLRDDSALSFQVRENGEVAAATYIAKRSAEAACFLRLWDEMGHATHRNPIPMLNTDNGVLLVLIARLIDEAAALSCEAEAINAARLRAAPSQQPSLHSSSLSSSHSSAQHHARQRSSLSAAAKAAVLGGYAYGPYTACFVRAITPSLLLHRLKRSSEHGSQSGAHPGAHPGMLRATERSLDRSLERPLELPWLHFYFPREGWHRSFETPGGHAGGDEAGVAASTPATDTARAAPRRKAKVLHQHHSLISLQPSTDLLGHGWKQMGQVLVKPPPECAPLQLDRSPRSEVLSAAQERALAVEMCWWLHPVHGAQAYEACHRPSAKLGAEGRVDLEYHLISSADGWPTTTRHVLANLTERNARRLFHATLRHRRRQHGARVRVDR